MSTSAHTVIVCASPDEPFDWFTASEIVDTHDLPPGIPCPRYPVRRRRILGWFTRWSARHLISVVRRFGAVTLTAGGRKSRLDFTVAAGHAHRAAVARWRCWDQVVRGLPVARPWPYFLAQHQATPAKVPYREAVRRFEAQPRVLAMLAHNAHPARPVTLDPNELDAYQAGEGTYATLHWQRAITGDMVITADGRLLRPASGAVADRLHYLSQALAYLHRLPSGSQLLALRVTTQP
ncbi:hypothetical protein [Actinoplanes subglobosus]|uniref:Uncharacterized protein n=1 Tax=Actinoplanes subglobosus TaxID=1547892 RepID=A0ABV8J5K6_9ACTN